MYRKIKTIMKTLYYTVEKELQDNETTGYKDIRVYDIINNKPVLVFELEAENEYNTINELNHFVKYTLQEEDFETHLDKEDTFVFELI